MENKELATKQLVKNMRPKAVLKARAPFGGNSKYTSQNPKRLSMCFSSKYTKMQRKTFPLLLSLLSLFACHCNSLPLSTNTSWIIHAASGLRVKLMCVNWAAHLDLMIAKGLDKQPLKDIAAQISNKGFNCVRLTYATFMFTEHAKKPVLFTVESLMAPKIMTGITNNNPSILNMTHIDAFDAVINELWAHNLMVVLDNHVSKPKWSSGNDDEDGFFGDRYFHKPYL
ncbi:Glycosyl hydrolase 5 family protein [Quillaja saponaria]|uniref:Glycosyl hydrolase 5 family protein n=1 Tax=Quillaja saponaria TaxID=32244 RepID=A0AAD7KW89_QUISA|nr:Glycosyl hydrolase 5 family protein [Quillaja saponaria]